ncbi:anaerobic C4-dicarboxylate transporter family protein, partial [Ancylomarina sp.]|uniref:anaerobic C4-dicarboxylate transporter family protein n=1 Tax=Ancylomarina sp. TaxID=1970196 RepID=UPI003563BA45
MFWIEFAVVLIAIFVGARLGGIGLGVMGGIGLSVLTFGFNLQPTSPPIDVMLMIVSVITAAASMQAAGGLDYLVKLAEGVLRKNPNRITYYGPIVSYLFTLVAGTGHVCYSILPVISEVARETGVRPERPLSIAVIASQQAITASPISAATVALLGMLTPYDFQLIDILMISIPSTFFGVLLGAFAANKMGKDLKDDPEYQKRLKEGKLKSTSDRVDKEVPTSAKISVALFILGAFAIVMFGSFESLRPVWNVGGKMIKMGMPATIEMVMMAIAALILLFSKVKVEDVAKGNVFSAGMQAVIAIFGIAWMGDTFFAANM